MAERRINNYYDLLIIGGSAGSLEVLIKLLPLIRKDLGLAVIIVLHRKNGESLLADILNEKSSWPAVEAEEKMPIRKNNIYIAPANYHLLIELDKSISLDYSEKLHHSRPAIDISFETASEAYGANAVGILLSGANADGAEGLEKIKKAGGLTIVQEPSDAAVSYMPQKAVDLFTPDYILDATEMAKLINGLNG